MKKLDKLLTLSLCLLIFPWIVNAQNSIARTYASGDIPTELFFYSSACSNYPEINILLPAGELIDVDSITVAYDFQSVAPYSPNAQNSSLYCYNTNQYTPTYSNTNGVPGATETLLHKGLMIANGTYPGGTEITILLDVWRSFGIANCGTSEQYVANNTFTITLYHSDPYEVPKVGINTNNPEATLDVNGKLRIKDDMT